MNDYTEKTLIEEVGDYVLEERKNIPELKSEFASEVTITVKDDEKTLKSKYLLYEEYNVSPDDNVIKKCIADTIKSFVGEPTDVKIRINFSM